MPNATKIKDEAVASSQFSLNISVFFNDMAIWNEAREEQMISMIQERPALYDIKENLYADRRLKAQLWHEIVSKLVISGK